MQPTARPLAPGDAAAYDELVWADPDAMVYATLAWRDFLAAAAGGKPRYLVLEDERGLAGALPALALTAAEGTVVNSLPWYGSHGGCILRDRGSADVRERLLAAFAAALPDDLVSCTVVLTPAESAHADTYATALRSTAEDARIGQVTDLPGPDGAEAALEQNFQQKTRNLVRKARRQGFERVVTDEEWAWDFLVATHEANIRAIGGLPKPRSHFDALRRTLPAEWLRLSVALDASRPVAALLLVRFARTVEYLTPVIVHDARPRQPLSFLIWEEMLAAVADGFARWNWGGTWIGQQSLHHFKAGFGARDLPYRYVVTAPQAWAERLPADARALAPSFPYYYVCPYA